MTPFVPFLPTLDQLEAMTPQQLFDHSTQCLIEQGKPCIGEVGVCDYSDKQGGHCALGWLIPTELQSWCQSLGGIQGLIDALISQSHQSPEHQRLYRVLLDHEELLQALQDAHDSSHNMDLPWTKLWPQYLHLAANSLVLSPKVLE
jgi:hypothetical protein